MLDLNSIMICNCPEETQTKYKIGLTKYELPKHNFSIKITNFQEYKEISNDYYDINYFMNYLYLWLEENKIEVPDTIKKFILEIIPKRITGISYKDFKGNDFENIDISIDNSKTSPKMILKKNPLFTDFINNLEQSRSLVTTYLSPIMSRHKKKIDDTYNIMPPKTKNSKKKIRI